MGVNCLSSAATRTCVGGKEESTRLTGDRCGGNEGSRLVNCARRVLDVLVCKYKVQNPKQTHNSKIKTYPIHPEFYWGSRCGAVVVPKYIRTVELN